MLVCICHGVKDQDIERAIQNGVNSVRQLSDKLRLVRVEAAAWITRKNTSRAGSLVRPSKKVA